MSYTCCNGIWKDGAGNVIKTAPIQKIQTWTGGGQIPYEWAEEAYKEYSAQYGNSQTLERLNQRGGFGAEEVIGLLIDRIRRIEGRTRSSEKEDAEK